MNKKTFFISMICIIACLSLMLNGVMFFTLVKTQKAYQLQQTNNNVSNFQNMFIEKVLLSDKEIDLDTRLELETAVRALGDEEIFTQWQSFVNSATKEDATIQAKKLLELLIQKTS